MHLTRIQIRNLRSIRHLVWRISKERAAGWHVILGPNGSGKSSLLQGVALGVLGRGAFDALRVAEQKWIRKGEERSEVDLRFDLAADWDKPWQEKAETRTELVRSPESSGPIVSRASCILKDPEQGYFSASFGPFRSFSGRSIKNGILESNPRLARHLSLFEEDFPLVESLEWLRDLRFKELDGKLKGSFLKNLISFINQPGFLPFETRLETIDSTGVHFVDGNDCEISIEDLSDGYRSILSMTLEIIHQLSREFPDARHPAFGRPARPPIFGSNGAERIDIPGIVLIDEVDAHLHPSWQRRVGFWFRKRFPNMQFLVTTHSPLVCQAAVEGSVFVLPEPGTDDEGRMLEGAQLDRLTHGNVLEAYGSDAFGSSGARSDVAEKQLERLAELSLREIEAGLTPEDKAELDRLRATFPTEPHPLARGHAAGT